MKTAAHLSVILTMVILTSVNVKGSLTVTGSSKVKKNENDIVVTCQVTSQSPAITFVYFISMFMNSSTASANSDYVEIVKYGVVNPSGQLLNTMASRNSVVLTGSTNVPTPGSPAYLTMTIPKTDIRCTDAAMYKCGASVATNTGTSLLSSDKVLTVEIEVSPNSINPLNLSPFGTAVDNQQNTYRYTVGSVVTVSCTSKVGRPARDHRWCKKGPNDQEWTEFTGNKMIDQRTPLYNPSTCDYTRTSTLTFNVAAQDTKTDIMCETEDGKNFLCASSTYQAQVTLLNDYTQSDGDITTDYTESRRDTTTDYSQSIEDTATNGCNTLVVFFGGTAFGGVLVAVVLIGIFIYLRRRRPKDNTQRNATGSIVISGGLGSQSPPNDYEELEHESAALQSTTRTNSNVYEGLGRQSLPTVYEKLNHGGIRTADR